MTVIALVSFGYVAPKRGYKQIFKKETTKSQQKEQAYLIKDVLKLYFFAG